MRKNQWSSQEDKVLLRLHPDYSAVMRALPDRSIGGIRRRAQILKLKSRIHRVSAHESSVIKSLWPDVSAIKNHVPGLLSQTIRIHARKVLLLPPIRRPNKKFSADEISAIKQGVTHLPGRTKYSIYSIRQSIGALIRPRWTTAEIAAIKAEPYVQLSGRTMGACAMARHKLALNNRSSPTHSTNSGVAIIQTIQHYIPNSMPRQIREELLSDLALAVLEGEVELANVATAVSKAIKGVYKRYPVLGAPVSLDMPLFDDGGATLGDRITSDTFHF